MAALTYKEQAQEAETMMTDKGEKAQPCVANWAQIAISCIEAVWEAVGSCPEA